VESVDSWIGGNTISGYELEVESVEGYPGWLAPPRCLVLWSPH